MSQKLLRIGRISYTNTLPVYFYFDQERFEDRIDFSEQVPAQLNREMANGEIDVGPISSFSYAEHEKQYMVLSSLSVSADGKVGSIFLFSKRPIEQLDGAHIALTNTSATSVNLLKIILKMFYKLDVSYEVTEPKLSAMMQQADACLLIGDDALLASRNDKEYHVYDLGELWKQFTGYPMTFAVWAVRRAAIAEQEELLHEVHKAFLQSKEKSKQNLDKVAAYTHEKFGGECSDWLDYFRGLQYDLTPLHREGLEHFYRCAYELGLLPEPVKVTRWDARQKQLID